MQIDTTPISEEFSDHLSHAGERVLFSGKFGVGKTTFLKEYFDNHSDYLAIHLFPVNYSVASNEDIFQLIKFDILFELLKPEYQLKFDEIKFDDLLLATYFTKEKLLEVITALLATLPKVGKRASELVKSINKLEKEFVAFKSEAETDELNEVTTFLKSFRNQPGSIYEHDLYTDLIENFLLQIKKRERKKIILIIDDLERVDPEHLFRLLNIFSAHVDNGIGENKFGFDKVLFVLDFQNASHIFSHLYGVNTNFDGYIDKFYSRTIFEFDTKKFLASFLESFYDSLNLEGKESDKVFYQELLISSKINDSLTYILVSMFLSGVLSLRKFRKRFNGQFYMRTYVVNFDGVIIENRKLSIVIMLDFLKSLFNNTESLISNISNTSFLTERSGGTYQDSSQYLNCNMAALLDYERNEAFNKMNRKMSYLFDSKSKVNYSISRNTFGQFVMSSESHIFLDYKKPLLDVIQLLKEKSEGNW